MRTAGGRGSCDCNGDTGAEYPMDYYVQDGGNWSGSYLKKKGAANGAKCCSFTGNVKVS